MASRDQEIREALKTAMLAALDTDSAKVFDYWALGMQLDDWPGMLRLSSGIVHGYVMHWLGGEPRGEWSYQITGLHSHKGRDSVNDFGDALEALIFALRPGLMALTSYGEVEHDGLTWRIDVSEIRNELTQVAVGNITFKFSAC